MGGDDEEGGDPGSLSRRLLWFGTLWLGGVATVSLIALLVRAVVLP